MNLKTRLCLIATLICTGCSFTDPLVLYTVEPAAAVDRVRIPASRVLVRPVSLPEYASGEEIFLADEKGNLRSIAETTLWADDPVRGVTLTLALNLGEVTGATVAADPWPLADSPEADIDVRISRAYAEASGSYRFSGQVFVLGPRDRSFRFDYSVPEGDPDPGVRAARGLAQALRLLAVDIARRGF